MQVLNASQVIHVAGGRNTASPAIPSADVPPLLAPRPWPWRPAPVEP